ncbi:hypothetical protein AYI69_g2503 [Smittium culicis]|uniref:Uncharacterized protein n=1 Tax=Smittium culicis TaxID=133412 RepID=A0A1R1YMD7_9FUNG|nr:hypothetical protein AYI69_g2503 [Smittium culicis]
MNDIMKPSLKFSLPEPAMLGFSTPSASLSKYDALKTNTNKTWKHDTPKISGDDKDLTKNESSAANSATINRLRGTAGLKKPPAYSINLKKLASDKNQKVSPDENIEADASRDEVETKKTKGINKNIIESDYSQD